MTMGCSLHLAFLFLLLTVTVPKISHSWELVGHDEEMPTVFTGIGMDGAPLVDRILEVESSVCGSSVICGPDFPDGAVRTRSIPACQVCQCDATCVRYHTCCPDVVLKGKVDYRGQGSECVQLKPTSIDDSFIEWDFLAQDLFSSMITTCLNITNHRGLPLPGANVFEEDENTINDRRRRCQKPLLSKPDEALPVSDRRTGYTYRNVHCARCNDVTSKQNMYTWKVNVTCTNGFDRLLPVGTKQQLFEMLSTETEVERTGCHMVYLPKEKEYRRQCRHAKSEFVDTCFPGYRDSPFYSEDIERACGLYTSLFLNKYKNMFCFLCNQHGRWTLNELLMYVHQTGGNPSSVSFSVLIDFSDDEAGEEDYGIKGGPVVGEGYLELASTCSSAQIYDNITCSCRDIQCSEWGRLDEENKACHPKMQSPGLGYRGCLLVSVGLLAAPTIKTIDELPSYFKYLQPKHRYIVTISRWCPEDLFVYIHLEIWETRNDTTVSGHGDLWEKKFLDEGDAFCDFIYRRSQFGAPIESCTFGIVDVCPEYTRFNLPCYDPRVTPVMQTDVVPKEQPSHDDNERPPPTARITFLPYRRLDQCAFVEVPREDFNVSSTMLVHGVTADEILISKAEFIRNETVIRLCLTDYLQLSQGNSTRCGESEMSDASNQDSFWDEWTTAGVISMVTSCISLLFLLLTFITYLLFDELRSGGFKNIMVLTVNLFVSQALYEFAIEQYENKTLCSIFGILIHYSWLAAVFSMNACTVERFVKLSFPLESRSFFMSKKPFIIATVYTLLCPAIIVGSNICANIALRNNIGYGSSRLCYINKRYSRIFTFVVPLFAIVLLNVVLLVVTIVKLRRKSRPGDMKTSTASSARIGLVACVRLSIVTGAIWLISLLYEIVAVKALAYIFTALLGLQGVVFFFSLLGNKRVLNLYIQLLKPKRWQRSESSGNNASQPTADTVVSVTGREKAIQFDNLITEPGKTCSSLEEDDRRIRD